MAASRFKDEIEVKMKTHYAILMLLTCMVSVLTNAQSKKYIKRGNRLYEAKKYKDASTAYMEALKKDPTNATGMYNLGNSLYQQKQYESARKVMDATAKNIRPKEGKAAVNYNVGNTYMAEQKWEDAVDAYKKALRNNPQDADAKYNLSFAEQMLKKQQQGGGGKNKQNNKNQNKDDKNKNDKQNQDKNKQGNKNEDDKGNKDQNQDQNKGDKEDKQQDQHPQSQPSKLTEKQAEQLLNALQQEEKKLQGKLQKGKGTPVKVEKDW